MMNRSESSRRELELERRIFRFEQLLFTEQERSDATLKLAKYLANIPKLYFPQVYPPGSCYGGPAQTYPVPPYSFPSNYQLGNVTTPSYPALKGCGWSNYDGIATPKDPDVVWKYVVYMTYMGVTTEVLSVAKVCVGTAGGSAWVVNPSSGITQIPLLDESHPVSFSSEFLFANPINTVFRENITSNFVWHDKANKLIPQRGYPYYDWPYWFIGGAVAMSVDPTTPPTASEPPTNHGDPVPVYGKCTVGLPYMFGIPGTSAGPKKPKVTLTGDTAAKDTKATISARCKITLLSVETGEWPASVAYPIEVRQLAYQMGKAGLEAFVGSSVTVGNDGDQCVNYATSGNSTVIEKSVSSINAIMTGEGGGATELSGGRWAESTPLVGRTSCENPPSVYESLPTKVSLGRPAGSVPKATGFTIRWKKEIDDTQIAYQVTFGSNGNTIPVPVGPLSPGSSYTFTDKDTAFTSGASVWAWTKSGGARDIGGCKARGTWRIEFL